LHHTLATVAYLRSLQSPIAGFAFCRTGPDDSPLAADNAATLASLTGLPYFGALPYLESLSRGARPEPAAAGSLWAPLAASLDAWLHAESAVP
jgi:dethiobiotin synthetase